MPTDSLIRWTYKNSDAVVEGPRAKYDEMERRAEGLERGAPVLLDGESSEPEPSTGDPADLIEHLGGGWYSVEGREDNVRGRDAALAAAEELV